jgi:hypothetical protein
MVYLTLFFLLSMTRWLYLSKRSSIKLGNQALSVGHVNIAILVMQVGLGAILERSDSGLSKFGFWLVLTALFESIKFRASPNK